MKLNSPPILLTSCVIVSDHSVALKDENARIEHTLESVAHWLAISKDLDLVICDGSNFDFSPLVRDRFPQASIECLCFQNNREMVKLHGKGYGEGEIVKYALLNSSTLSASKTFAKCTAKLWVENFFECLAGWDGRFLCKGHFADVFSFRKTRFEFVDTRFYLSEKSFYLKYFDAAYLNVGGAQWRSLEDCFKDIITKEKFEKILFAVPPVICGVGGGSGKYYKNNLRRRTKERLRLWLVKRNRSFRALFE